MDDMLAQVEPMIPALRRYARGLVRDVETADDIVQDCLEKIVGNWHRRRNDDPRSWMFAILHNLAVNKIRQMQRRGKNVPIEDVPATNDTGAPTQEQTVFSHDVIAAIERLPHDQRSILLLISVEDLTYAEAAEVLGVPIGTVMSRLSRAREQLRILLERPPSNTLSGVTHIRRVK